MKRALGVVLLGVFFAVSLGGCACTRKEAKSEPPPAQVAEKPYPRPAEPVQPVPPKKDRN